MVDTLMKAKAKAAKERRVGARPQPRPIPNDKPSVWQMVINDMHARDAVGQQRYGTPLQPHNGRDALVDAYQEALDLCAYLRQAIAERDDDEK